MAAAASTFTPAANGPDSPAGYYYGSDGGWTITESSQNGYFVNGYYKEPENKAANFGGYIGESSYWPDSQCGQVGLDNSPQMASYAAYNQSNHNLGAGTIAYYMGAGAGRDGGLTDSAWGIEQAQDAISGTTSHGFSYKYIFFDAEPNGGSGSLDNGWTTNWTTTCGTSSNGSVASADNVNVFNSWWDYFSGHTQYMPGAYSSPAQGPNSWSAYFGSTGDLSGLTVC
jgi:hypothetical protein